jgi:hypothetical protein
MRSAQLASGLLQRSPLVGQEAQAISKQRDGVFTRPVTDLSLEVADAIDADTGAGSKGLLGQTTGRAEVAQEGAKSTRLCRVHRTYLPFPAAMETESHRDEATATAALGRCMPATAIMTMPRRFYK